MGTQSTSRQLLFILPVTTVSEAGSKDREGRDRGWRRGKGQAIRLPLSHWIWNPSRKQDASGSVRNVFMNLLCVYLLFIRSMDSHQQLFPGEARVFNYILSS